MKTIQSYSKTVVSIVAMLFVVLFGILANGCGGGGGGVSAPGVPTNFIVVGNQGGQELSATLTWDVPTTGSVPTSYEIYRSTTAGTVFDSNNHLKSIQAVEGEISYVYIDYDGLVNDVPFYYVVAAKNVDGETPTTEKSVEFTTGEVESYGNNFASAMIFADGYGITGELIPEGSVWTEDNLSEIVYETGLRPSIDQNLTVFPYFDESTTFVKEGVTYYRQQTVSTWQGEWQIGTGNQEVNATWGDNLFSQTLNTESVIRIEMVLTKDLVDNNMTSYKMVSLYGNKYNEIYGTDKTTYENNTSFVFAANAHLKIQKVAPTLEAPLYDEPLWQGDGPGNFASEVNVAGKFTYGFVWQLGDYVLPYEKAGTWRITFSLDETSPVGTSNHTLIQAVTEPTEEGSTSSQTVLVSPTEVYIDINITQ